MPRFTLTDESVNRYGFRVLTSGINLEHFRKNPVMLYMHDRSLMPIGKWEDLKVEGGKITAEATFDENDPVALQVKSKVDGGFLNTCSIGFTVLEISEDPKHLEKGQTRPTVTKAELFECSICDIPGNRNAVKLSFPEKGLTLTGEMPQEFLNSTLPQIKLQLSMKKVILAAQLLAASLQLSITLSEDATDEQVSEALNKINDKLKANAGELVLKMGESAGLINDQNKERIKKLAAVDANLALEFLTSEQPATTAPAAGANAGAAGASGTGGKDARLADVIRQTQQLNAGPNQQQQADPRANWDMRDWEKKDSKGLLKMKREEAEKYQELFNRTYQTA